MSEENTENMNFFKRIITSIKDFDKYQIFALEKTSTAIKYLIIIILIFSIIVACACTYKVSTFINSLYGYFEENIDDIYYENEKLSINSGEEKTYLTDYEILPIVIINTSETQEQQKYIDKINEYKSGIVLLNDRILLKTEMLNEPLEYLYKDIADVYQITEFNKEDVTSFIQNTNTLKLYCTILLMMIVYMFFIYFISTLLDAVMLAILGFIFARIVGMKIKWKACFNMGIYALTLPIILNFIYIIVNTFTGLYVQYFQWMYTTISYIYMLVAILIIKADYINKQMELMKIIEEQEKVKKEIEQKQKEKEEEKEKDKDKNNKGNEKEQKKKNEKPKGKGLEDNGLAPQE